MTTPHGTRSDVSLEQDAGGGPPARRRRGSLLAKENRRLLYGLIVGALTAAFAIVNLDQVQVNWVLGTGQTPLILVIAVSFVLGALAGWIAGASRRKARS